MVPLLCLFTALAAGSSSLENDSEQPVLWSMVVGVFFKSVCTKRQRVLGGVTTRSDEATLDLAREGWVQHEKKSGRPVVSIHPKERNRRRLRVTARGAHTNTGHYCNVPVGIAG